MSLFLQTVRPVARDSEVDVRDRREVAGAKHPYRVGRQYEQAVAGVLRRRGWYTHRAHGSKGVIDLFAWRAGEACLWVQCKATGDIGTSEWNRVYDLATAYGAVPVVAFRVGRTEHALMRLDARRAPRSPRKPWTRIDPATMRDIPLQLAVAA